jgi:putative phosphotransacetylase
MKIPIETSNRHVHLCKEDLDSLFGKGYNLKVRRKLSQPGEFAAEETVSLLHNGFEITDVRILGPPREQTQVELLTGDLIGLGFSCPVKKSGDFVDTPGIRIRGPNGEVKTKNGTIVANRHLHLTPEDALKIGLKKEIVCLKVKDKILDDVVVRTSPDAKVAVHINKDDPFAIYVDRETFGELI